MTLKAPYSEPIIEKVIKTYGANFQRGAVLWKATNRPEDGIAFRFYERETVDVINPAITSGLLSPDHPLIPLISSWSALYSNAISSCDFDPQKGLRKTWIWLGGRRPLDELLNADNVPMQIKALGPKFHALGLDTVRHAAVDWQSSTINLYFWVNGEIDLEQANKLVTLARSPPITQENLAEIKPYLIPSGFTFAATVKADTGHCKRVGIYALRLDGDNLPALGDRLSAFFKDAKSYDQQDVNIVAWSFGGGNAGVADYLKGERSYTGGLLDVLRGWDSPLKD
jgi:4-hydroxyphenylpyruvate 3-dimethylallyltransferase